MQAKAGPVQAKYTNNAQINPVNPTFSHEKNKLIGNFNKPQNAPMNVTNLTKPPIKIRPPVAISISKKAQDISTPVTPVSVSTNNVNAAKDFKVNEIINIPVTPKTVSTNNVNISKDFQTNKVINNPVTPVSFSTKNSDASKDLKSNQGDMTVLQSNLSCNIGVIPEDTGPPICISCLDCECVRIKLRKCGHIVCVPCMLLHVQGEIQLRAKVRIRCLMDTCPKTIHENDINAVLDDEEDGLNAIMPLEHRKWLQYCHNKDNIIMGLAGPNLENQERFIKRCPTCRTIYYKREGCNNVRCANIICNTQFCWQCGRPTRGFSHFAGNTSCNLSTDDMERGFFLFRLARDVHPIGVLFGIPVMFSFFFFICPVLMLFLFPYACCKFVTKKAKSNSNFLTVNERFLMLFKIVTVLTVTIPSAFVLAVGFYVTGFFFFLLYILFFLLKMTPKSSMILDRYDRFIPFAKWMGLMRYKYMLKDVREARRLEKDRKFDEKERDKEEEGTLIRANNEESKDFPTTLHADVP